MAKHSTVPAVEITTTAIMTSSRGSSALARYLVMVIGKPMAAIAASRLAPEVMPENTPTADAEYL